MASWSLSGCDPTEARTSGDFGSHQWVWTLVDPWSHQAVNGSQSISMVANGRQRMVDSGSQSSTIAASRGQSLAIASHGRQWPAIARHASLLE